ncbi:MAG: aminotransferase class IV [Peptostreptococcaceae bacterium]|jgi:4-amino-4-deoxychorismate lyase|nr:aminotransferase class IV [Peptostreptococcaceae bacterium]
MEKLQYKDTKHFKFGIGLFETIKILNKKPIFLEEHLNRLKKSIIDLKLNYEINFISLKNDIKKIALLYDKKAIRITINEMGYNIALRDINYNKLDYKKGYSLCFSNIKRGYSFLYNHKTTSYYENMYNKEYALGRGFDDSIFLDTKDSLLETSFCNIFFTKDNNIYTPKIENQALNGIVRTKIFKIAEINNLNIQQLIINIDDIKNFEGCFITNSLMNIIYVNSIENIVFKETNIIKYISNQLKNIELK